jgi:hypothetical protein
LGSRDPQLAHQALCFQPVAEQQVAVLMVILARIAFQRANHPQTVWRHVDCGGRIHRVGHADQRRPKTGKAGHLKPVQTIVEHVLNVRRVENRHFSMFKEEFALRRQNGGFGKVIVPGQSQNTAVAVRARCVPLTQRITGPVNTWRLAVPDAKDTVIFCRPPNAAFTAQLLAAPDRGRAKLFVHARLEYNFKALQVPVGALQLSVISSQRRPAIPGNEPACFETCLPVQARAVQSQSDQRLNACQIHTTVRRGVFVFKADIGHKHIHSVFSSYAPWAALCGELPFPINIVLFSSDFCAIVTTIRHQTA